MEAVATIRHNKRSATVPVIYETEDDLRRLITTLDPVELITIEADGLVMTRCLLGIPAHVYAERDGEKGDWRN